MSQSATGVVAFIELIGANRITSPDSFNSQDFPLNHPRAAQLITHARLFYASKQRSGVTVNASIRNVRLEITRGKCL